MPFHEWRFLDRQPEHPIPRQALLHAQTKPLHRRLNVVHFLARQRLARLRPIRCAPEVVLLLREGHKVAHTKDTDAYQHNGGMF